MPSRASLAKWQGVQKHIKEVEKLFMLGGLYAGHKFDNSAQEKCGIVLLQGHCQVCRHVLIKN
jgi:hypothetical protein